MDYQNLSQLHRRQAERFGPRPALRYRRHGLYHDLSWEDYHKAALACAAALVEAGVQPGDRVGLLAENRLEWLLADMGILAAGAVNVPPHAPLTARQVHYQLADAGARWLFVSTRQQWQKVESVRRDLPALEGVVVFDSSAVPAASAVGDALPWSRFLQRGWRALPRLAGELARREAALGPDDLATIMYTSGTTGNPKGVMLTHGNLLSNAFASLAVAGHEPDDVVLNWLPLSHVYARSVDHYQSLAGGLLLGLAESAETLVRDLQEAQPTHLSSVPRFYEKVLTAVAGPDRATMHRCLRGVFGPRIRWLGAGGAPLPRPIAEAYQAAGLPIYQGYGLTESSPVISFNRKEWNKLGTVGQALPGVEIAIAADGEVLTRGPHVMKGYWNNPTATAEAIRDGWLYTGDLGELDADGFLTITGRKKELLVLSNGKKVVPSQIEGLLLGDECIDQAMVCGEGQAYVTALIVPHWDNLRRALRAQDGAADPSEGQLARRSEVYALLTQRIERALVDVASWEKVKKFHVLPGPFTVAADELTVSLKLRREVILRRYASQLDALYQD